MADMVKYPDFVQDGQLTPDGGHLLEFMVAQFEEADKSNDVNRLNSLHGPIAEYYTLVHKLGLKSPANWMTTMPQSARNAYDLMKYVESVAERDAKVDATSGKADEIADQLAAFKESIDEEMQAMRDEIERLTEANKKLVEADTPSPKPARKKRAATVEPVEDAGGDAEEPETDEEA